METEGHGGAYFASHHRCSDVPTMADEDASRSVVSQYGCNGSTGSILRHGDLQIDFVLCDSVCGPSWSLALSQSLRGRWIHGQLQTGLGMAGGT